MIGLLNVNKPVGVTSRHVVNQVQRLVRPTKIGHAGTLDPLATGVLVLCIGKATRLIPYVQQMRKRYLGTFLLGRTSDTEDIDGAVTELTSPPVPTEAEILAVVPEFIGEIQQRPPAYSALKVAGRRAYQLARSGQTVELAPRPVMIYGLQLLEFDYPRIVLQIECGSGTYVRSLGRDLAERLGTAAVMSDLVRTGIGEFDLRDALQPDEITHELLPSQLKPAIAAVPDLPRVTLSAEESALTSRGMTIDNRFGMSNFDEFAAVDASGKLLAILIPRQGGLGPLRNFSDSN